jgi:hypothetical protein
MRPLLLVIASFVIYTQAIKAAPPYLTTSAETVKEDHGKLYLLSQFDKVGSPTHKTLLNAPTLRGEWGAASNLELDLTIPLATFYPLPPKGERRQHAGLGDITPSFKYRFLEMPCGLQAAFVPALILPTGNNRLSLGNGKLTGNAPVWVHKKWGPWMVIGGGGYAISHAPKHLNFFFWGGGLFYDIPQNFKFGVELFYNQKTEVGTQNHAILNAGGHYYLSKNIKLILSAGHSLFGTRHFIGLFGFVWES